MSEALETRTRQTEAARTAVRRAVERAWAGAVRAGALPALPPGADSVALEVVRPGNPEHGDFSTNLALKLARPLRRSPMEIALALRNALSAPTGRATSEPATPAVAEANVAPPGFLNFRLGTEYVEAAMDAAREDGAAHIDLTTSEDDTAARALYRRCGFVDRERPPDGPIMLYYERDL